MPLVMPVLQCWVIHVQHKQEELCKSSLIYGVHGCLGKHAVSQGSQQKQTTVLWTTLIHCLLPHWEALPDSAAVNASALFLDPVSILDFIFSYINYPNIWLWSLWYRKQRSQNFITKRKQQASLWLYKVVVPTVLAAVGHIIACLEETNHPLFHVLTKTTSVTSLKCGSSHHMVGLHSSAWQPPCSRLITLVHIWYPWFTLSTKNNLFYFSQLEKPETFYKEI